MDLHYQSPWFIEALEKEKNLEVNQLDLNLDTDICIIGGGFTGLWAALKIKEKKPSTNIILIEKDLCGSGASGRNGGCMIPQSTKFQGIEKVVGTEDAKKIVLATEDAVNDIKNYFDNWGSRCYLGNNSLERMLKTMRNWYTVSESILCAQIATNFIKRRERF